jgi:hypothetical protein
MSVKRIWESPKQRVITAELKAARTLSLSKSMSVA